MIAIAPQGLLSVQEGFDQDCLPMHPTFLRKTRFPSRIDQGLLSKRQIMLHIKDMDFPGPQELFKFSKALNVDLQDHDLIVQSRTGPTYLQCSVSLKPSKESLSAKLRLCSRPRTGFLQGLKDLFSPTRPTLHSYCLHQELAAVDRQWWIVSLLIFSATRNESKGQATTWLGKFHSKLLIQMNSNKVCWKETSPPQNSILALLEAF